MDHNGNIYARLKDTTGQTGSYATGVVTNIDKLGPNAFTASAKATEGSATYSITASGQTTDQTSEGYEGDKNLTYYFKIESTDDGKIPENEKDWIQSYGTVPGGQPVSYTFDGLEQGKTYKVTMRAVDAAKNETISTPTENIQLDKVPDLDAGTNLVKGNVTFDYSTTNWTNGKVTVGITSEVDGYEIWYNTGDPINGTWTKYNDTAVEFTENGYLYVRLQDIKGQFGGTASGSVQNIDTTLPDISGSIGTTVTATSITPSLTATDAGGSGIAKVEWSYKKTKDSSWKTGETNSYQNVGGATAGISPQEVLPKAITGLDPATEYDIKAVIYDVANNTKEVSITNVKTADQKAERVTVSPTEVELNTTTNKTTTLTATVSPSNTTNQKVTWTSETPTVATVDANTGVVTAVKAGTAIIKATAQDQSGQVGQCTVTVKQLVTNVTVTPTEATIKVDEKVTLTASIEPNDATNQKLTWSATPDGTVSIDESDDGKTATITGIKEGIATVTVQSQADANKKATSTITVKPKEATLNVALKVEEANVTGEVIPISVKKVTRKEDDSEVTQGNLTYTWSYEGSQEYNDGKTHSFEDLDEKKSYTLKCKVKAEDGEWGIGEVTVISFKIHTKYYRAEKGMNWITYCFYSNYDKTPPNLGNLGEHDHPDKPPKWSNLGVSHDVERNGFWMSCLHKYL